MTESLLSGTPLTFLYWLYRIVGRCGANQNKHNCRANNPCAPARCEDDVYFYNGASNNKYVECLENGTCIEQSCPRGTSFIDGSCQ